MTRTIADIMREPTTEEADFAGRNSGLIQRDGVWYRLNGWGLADDWSSTPLIRVPDDHARAILRAAEGTR